MTNVSDEFVLAKLQWRYAGKAFDPQVKIPPTQWRTIEESLRLSPSSYGVSPWHFVVVSDPAVKKELPAITHQQQQVVTCSHVVVFCVRRDYTESDVAKLVDRTAAVRQQKLEDLDGFRGLLTKSVVGQSPEDKRAYLERQVYIALGFGLYTAAALGIDVCPMEGIDNAGYDERFKLADLGYRSLCIACFGYRDPNDPYLKKAKVRFDRRDVFTHFPPENQS